MTAVADVARLLARAEDWEADMPDIIKQLGVAAAASRSYLFKNVIRDDGELAMTELFEWVAPAVSPSMEENQAFPYAEGHARLITFLGIGEIVHGLARDFPPEERVDLGEEGTLSAVYVPIFVGDQWWGYMGFDDCVTEREWQTSEIQSLRAAAEIIGSGIERTMHERERRVTQARYRALVEQIPAILYIDSISGDEPAIYVGPQIEPILGITQEEWLGTGDAWVSHMHPDEAKAAGEEYAAWMESGDWSPKVQEYRMIRADGRTVWIRDEFKLVRDPDGGPPVVQGVMYDITEQKAAMDKMAEAEEKFRTLVEELPVAVYQEDFETADVSSFYVSPQIERILGYPPARFEEPGFWETVIFDEDRDRVLAADRFTNEQGSAFDVEYRMVGASGDVVWIQDQAILVRDATGKPLFWQGLWEDVSAEHASREQLAEAEERFRRLVEQVPAVIYTDAIDENGTTTYISPRILDLLGFTPEQWIQNTASWFDALHPDDKDRAWEEYEEGRDSGAPWALEYRMRRVDGDYRWIREEDMVVTDSTGVARMVQGVMYDITERKEAEEAAAQAETKYRAIIEQIPAITYLDPVDEDELSLYVSPQIQSILGCSQEMYVEVPSWWSDHLHPEDKDRVWEAYERARDHGEAMVQEYRMIRDDGRLVWIREEAATLFDEKGKPWLVQGLMHDITERKVAEEQVAYMAYHDALTGLANRALLEEMLEASIARARRSDTSVALLFMDLDGFKEVNDTLGHDTGDMLLRAVADRLVEATRDTDVVARQGGDEFLVLLSDISKEDQPSSAAKAMEIAELMAQRVHHAMRSPIAVGEHEVSTSASIGISVFPSDASDMRTLMKNADAAMYESKRAHSGGYRIHRGETGDPLTELSFAKRLHEAVKDEDWTLHYQPVVDLADATMVGVETLLRWRRPKGGLIMPGEFLPLAEEMGLTEAIGEWVIEQMAAQAAAWSAEGVDLWVSFNLSPRQLWQRNVADKVMKDLREAGLDPSRAIVEITEATAMTDPSRTAKVLWKLKERGLRVAIDDFGTGYSPPSRLEHLPVDIIKIDQPIVRDLLEDPEVANFIEAVVEFARDLDIVPLAVGVENEEQRSLLQELGCGLGQGYLFSRPTTPQRIVELARGITSTEG